MAGAKAMAAQCDAHRWEGFKPSKLRKSVTRKKGNPWAIWIGWSSVPTHVVVMPWSAANSLIPLYWTLLLWRE